MVELEGSRTLVPSCSRGPRRAWSCDRQRAGAPGPSDGAGVPGLLRRPVDHADAADWLVDYEAEPSVTGRSAAGPERDAAAPGTRSARGERATVAQPTKVDNDLYVRDYGKCILCYKCVDACGEQWQNTFAIAVAGRGFDAASPPSSRPAARIGVRVLRQLRGGVPDRSADVPLGARAASGRRVGRVRQTRTDTICPYCGVGCTLTLHVQDNTIVKVTSPHDHASPAATSASRAGSASSTCRRRPPTRRVAEPPEVEA